MQGLLVAHAHAARALDARPMRSPVEVLLAHSLRQPPALLAGHPPACSHLLPLILRGLGDLLGVSQIGYCGEVAFLDDARDRELYGLEGSFRLGNPVAPAVEHVHRDIGSVEQPETVQMVDLEVEDHALHLHGAIRDGADVLTDGVAGTVKVAGQRR